MAQGQKIGDAFVEISAKFDKLDAQVKKSTNRLEQGFSRVNKGLNSQFTKLGATFAAAFAVDKVVAFTAESVKLAATAEGVEAAFKRLGDPTLLNSLTEATKGTVSQLELMRKAVSAQNLGVPIQNLASLFEFATQRASETGESVDYLVNSIVTGIGRKSPLILDNLGISAVELREKLNGVGLETASVGDIAEAVGQIASEAMEGIGDSSLTSAQKMAQMSARIQDLQVSIGQGLTPVFLKLLEVTNNFISAFELAFSSDRAKLFAEKFEDLSHATKVANSEIERSIKLGKEKGLTDEQIIEHLVKQKNNLIELNKHREKEREKAKGVTEWAGRLSQAYKDNDEKQRILAVTIAESNAKVDEYTAAINRLSTSNEKTTSTVAAQADALFNLKLRADEAANAIKGVVAAQKEPPKGTKGVGGNAGVGKGNVTNPFAGATTGGEKFRSAAQQQQDQLDQLINKYQETSELAQMWGASVSDAWSLVSDAAMLSGNKALAQFANFAKSLTEIAVAIITRMMAMAQANAIASATQTGASTGPAAAFTTPMFIAQMVGLVVAAFASIPKFAMGGRSNGGLSLVGERGPELVNLPNGSNITPNHMLSSFFNGTEGNNVFFGGMVRGNDIVISARRQENRNTRFRPV